MSLMLRYEGFYFQECHFFLDLHSLKKGNDNAYKGKISRKDTDLCSD